MPDAPCPMTATRLPRKLTPCCGHLAVCRGENHISTCLSSHQFHVSIRYTTHVVHFSLEVTQTGKGWRIVLRSKSNAWHEPTSLNLGLVGGFNGPEIRLGVEGGCVYALVVRRVLANVPLLLDVLKVPSQLRPCGIPLLVCEVFPELFIE